MRKFLVIFIMLLLPVTALAIEQNQGQGQSAEQNQGQNMDFYQKFEASDNFPVNRVPNPAQLYNPGLPQIFGNQSVPGNANPSFLNMLETFPPTLTRATVTTKTASSRSTYPMFASTSEDVAVPKENPGKEESRTVTPLFEVVKADGESDDTEVVAVYYPEKKGSNTPSGIVITTVLQGRYVALGFLSVTADNGDAEYPVLISDAVRYVFDMKFNLTAGKPVILYVDPQGINVNLGNKGRTRSFSILGGGATLSKSGDMSFGGGIGVGGGEIYPVASLGIKAWILQEDSAGTAVRIVGGLRQPEVAPLALTPGEKAKGAGNGK